MGRAMGTTLPYTHLVQKNRPRIEVAVVVKSTRVEKLELALAASPAGTPAPAQGAPAHRLEWFRNYRPDPCTLVSHWNEEGLLPA
jgi:hypothetical protein